MFLCLPHAPHFRGVQNISSFALHLFSEAVGVKDLQPEKGREYEVKGGENTRGRERKKERNE